MKRTVFSILASSALAVGLLGAPVGANPDAPHQQQMEELPAPHPPGSDNLERQQLEAEGALFPLKAAKAAGKKVEKSAAPNIESDSIILGYAQTYGSSGDYVDFYGWEALTHVASTFITFDDTGNITNPSTWTGRDSNLLAGGAAEAAGTKVLMTVLNSGFAVSVINDVMTDAGKRSTLVDDIVALLLADGYSHGVTFDFEPFSWSAAATTGMTTFFSELRSDLDVAGLTSHEISIYTDPTPNTTQWSVSLIEPYVDHLFYSGYDWASGSTPRAITDHNSTTPQMDFYFDDDDTGTADDGFPPERLVYVISSYSRRWTGTTMYGTAGAFDINQGFTDALYDTTLNPNDSGPYANTHYDGDEAGWYTFNDGTDRTVTWDSPEALATKIGSSLSYADTSSAYAGRRLAGVGFWSLRWMAETSSWDPIASASAAKTRTYPQIYQICQELRAPAGTTEFVAAGFEGLNFRWRDPNDGPDDSGDSDNNSSRGVITAPAGAGRPASTTNAMQVSFDMESSGQLFFRHEMLASNLSTSTPDTNAVAAQFDSTTELKAYIYTSVSYANQSVRMIVMDADGELEQSPSLSLGTSGWRTMTWDLTDSVSAYTTSEPAFSSGDGVLDTAGGGEKDIAFVGFLITSSASGNGAVTFDEVTYIHVNDDGLDYVINEFRYDGSTGGEFVEIYGPAGAFPTGFQVRSMDGTATPIVSRTISGTVPNDGGGFGYFVVGDADVSNVDSSTGFSGAADDLSDNSPSAIQLYNSTTGGVYDSVVYEAFGGLDELVRIQNLGVINEGQPWFGEVASGTDSSGEEHTAGRYPDGTDTNINGDDFSLMKATPGASNGGVLTAGSITNFNFSSAPSEAFAAYQSIQSVASGVGASPGGGNVLRCVDTSGGGVVNYIGDAALGADGNGYHIAGELYIPDSADDSQAVGVGICGGQGSTFFSATRASSSYENGYWLIYENDSGADLDDELASHPGVVHFVTATHDNQDGSPVTSLGSLDISALEGTWADFQILIDPAAAAGSQLIAEVDGNTVYQGAIPTGGPTSGPIMVGFREFAGTVGSDEGTWLDTLAVGPVGTVDVVLDHFGVE